MSPKFSKKMKTDIEIARSIELVKIKQVARETGIPVEHISNYGRYIAKVDESQIDDENRATIIKLLPLLLQRPVSVRLPFLSD